MLKILLELSASAGSGAEIVRSNLGLFEWEPLGTLLPLLDNSLLTCMCTWHCKKLARKPLIIIQSMCDLYPYNECMECHNYIGWTYLSRFGWWRSGNTLLENKTTPSGHTHWARCCRGRDSIGSEGWISSQQRCLLQERASSSLNAGQSWTYLAIGVSLAESGSCVDAKQIK